MIHLAAAAAFVAVSLAWGMGAGDPGVPRWAVVHAMAVVAIIVAVWRVPRIGAADGWALALLGWAALSLLWSPDAGEGAVRLVNGMALVAVFMAASRMDLSKWLPPAAVVALSVVLLMLAWRPDQAAEPYFGGFGNSSFAAEFVLLALPFAVFGLCGLTRSWPRVVAVGLLAFAVGTYLYTGGSNTKWLVVAAGLAALLVWQVRKKYWFGAACTALVPINMAFLLGLWPAIEQSLIARLEIWVNTLHVIWTAPVFGNGLGGFDYVYAGFREAHLAWFPDWGTRIAPITMYAGEAHNEILQVWADLGLVGVVLGAFLVRAILRRSPDEQPYGFRFAAFSTLGIAAALSMTGFPLHNAATALLAVLAAAVVAPQPKPVVASYFVSPFIALTAPLVAVAILAVGGFSYATEVRMNEARLWIQADPLRALKANLAAYQAFSWPNAPRRQLALTLSRLTTRTGLRVELSPEAADRAFAIGATAEPDNPALAVARIDYLMRSGRWRDHRDEIEQRLAGLQRLASLQPETWLILAAWAQLNGDGPRSATALKTGYRLPASSGPHQKLFLALARNLRMETPP